jgi:beta-glucanase (GH16 family)
MLFNNTVSRLEFTFMKKYIPLQILVSFFLFCQISFAQVDVVYNDLVWSDEFNTNGVVNSTKWFHQTQLPAGGSWFNGEVQHYTNLSTNSFVNAGFLNIVAKKEPYTNQGITKQYTSARLNSKFAFKYGRVDVRAKLPIDAGTWPAIWMLGRNINEDGAFFDPTYGTVDWPACGEIDIMEHGITPSQPINYIQSALHTPSSFGNTMNIGGMIASDLVNNYHVYSMNWSPNQISFLLDNVIFYTYNPTVKNANNWPFDLEQYLLLNIAMGGIAGTINPNYSQSSMVIDYVRVYQNTIVDAQAPTNFTATIGAITGTSVELLLNANDNSGTVAYTIIYSGGTITVYNPSGVQKSVVIPNLASNTNYVFTVSATDITGNAFVNNPIILNATTTSNPQCTGTDTQSSEGTFILGYNYTFQTIGTDVKITFELLDNKVGLVAFLRRQSPFLETQMTNVSGQIFTQTITGQTIGSTIIYAVKFAFAGGLAVTKYFTYVVGNSCTLDVETSSELKQFSFPNPVENILYLKLLDNQNQITLTDILGKTQIEATVNSSPSIDMSTLNTGMYFLRVENSHGVQNLKIIKK